MSQSTEPSVCCVMLTANRPAMARQAVENFRAQTYVNKRLTVYDTGSLQLGITFNWEDRSEAHWSSGGRNEFWCTKGINGSPIGVLRNEANEVSASDILIHFDDDDFSHPNRITEQVALLQSSGADVVGYSDLLFWREPRWDLDLQVSDEPVPGEAWLYTSPGPKPSPPGTTLCYTREFWSRNPFPATSQGEELQFLSRAKVETVSSFPAVAPRGTMTTMEPRMIARIHLGAAGNTSTAYEPKKMLAESKRRNPAWRRTPEWDQYCQSVMARSAA